MTRTPAAVSPLAKSALVLISLVTATVGLLAICTGYVPERATRFGLAHPLFGPDATAFGLICLLLAGIPLLAFARSTRQASILGALLGMSLIAMIFLSVYSR